MSHSESYTDTGPTSAFYQGVDAERERIIKLLHPLAKHDEEMCFFEGKLECYPEDCNADTYISVIRLIRGEYEYPRPTKGEQQ